jgi:hypothetical protein
MKNLIKRWVVKVIAEYIANRGLVIGDYHIQQIDGALTIKKR